MEVSRERIKLAQLQLSSSEKKTVIAQVLRSLESIHDNLRPFVSRTDTDLLTCQQMIISLRNYLRNK